MANRSYWIEAWILRVGRRFCLLIGTLSVAAVALGTLVLVIGGLWWLLGAPKAPKLPSQPDALRPVSLEDARGHVEPKFGFDETSGDVPTVSGGVMKKVAVLQDLFPAPQYTWEEVYKDFCREPSSYGCLEKGRKLVRRGVGRFVGDWIQQNFENDDQDQMVEELKRVLATAPVEERAGLVAPVLVAVSQHRGREKKIQEEWESEVSRLKADHEAAVADHATKAGGMTMAGLMGIGWGLAAALSICLVVAILAIERHLRESRGPSVASDDVSDSH